MAKSYDEYRLGEPYERPRRKGLKTFAIVAALMAITIVPAMAAKGGGGGKGHGGSGGGSTAGGGGTINLAPLVKDVNGDGLPNWGDVVTFNISTTATDQPWVYLKCVKGTDMVAQGWAGYFDGSLSGRDFGLYSPAWTSGSADCTAYLETPQWAVLASTGFHVYA
jgi:hypothetical protein